MDKVIKTSQGKGDMDDPMKSLNGVDPTCTVPEYQMNLPDQVPGPAPKLKQWRCTGRSCIAVSVILRVILLHAALTVGGVDGASQDGLLSDLTTKIFFAVLLQLLVIATVAGPFLSWGLQHCTRYINTRVFALNRVERQNIDAINDQRV